MDAATQQPIPQVKVRRLSANENYRPMDPPKGGQLLEQALSVVTGKDGGFVLDSLRTLAPFQKGGWYSVSLSFVHPAYVQFSTTYTTANATNAAKGEPVVHAGDIPLVPLAK